MLCTVSHRWQPGQAVLQDPRLREVIADHGGENRFHNRETKIGEGRLRNSTEN